MTSESKSFGKASNLCIHADKQPVLNQLSYKHTAKLFMLMVLSNSIYVLS